MTFEALLEEIMVAPYDPRHKPITFTAFIGRVCDSVIAAKLRKPKIPGQPNLGTAFGAPGM